MRRILSAIGAATLLVALAAPVAADDMFDVVIAEGGITVECFTTEDLSSVVISGTVTVISGTEDFGLELRGNKPGQGSFAFLIDSLTIDNTGPGTYPYSFTIDASVLDEYNSLRVDAVSVGATVTPEKSRSFLDECRTVIPEAPVLGLFLVTAVATTGFVLWRRSTATSSTIAA
jgi:hypothetical protein